MPSALPCSKERLEWGGTAVMIGVAVGVALVLGIVACFVVKMRSAGGSDEAGRLGVANTAYEDPVEKTDRFGFGADRAQGYLEVDGTQTKR